MNFDWDLKKNAMNQAKHGVSVDEACEAFSDLRRIVLDDKDHSGNEFRFFCIGKTHKGIMTVRFTYRENQIRIFGAGYWRKGKRIYEETNGKIFR